MSESPIPVPHTVAIVLEDGQPTVQGQALVALADAPDGMTRAVVDVLTFAGLEASRERVREFAADPAPVPRFADHAAWHTFGRRDEDYRSRTEWPSIRPQFVEAAATLLAAIAYVDAETTATAEGGEL